ncbi:hypothetical protein SAMN03080617_02703 [Algoriphagus alkaliphilus]|uniref:Uncharacterized protein n=1 Tax=Algoriphagus alkaliphilus TaxID=279824 RepID=A0A1G5YPF6_9BACT|nr:hypothetical protein SAMN03080617_02703 [Algoriphagus alkaliphilus]
MLFFCLVKRLIKKLAELKLGKQKLDTKKSTKKFGKNLIIGQIELVG